MNLQDAAPTSTDKTYFKQLVAEKIDTQNLISEAKISGEAYTAGVISLKPKSNETLDTIISQVPKILTLLASPQSATQAIQLIGGDDISQLVSPDTLKQLAPSLDATNLAKLATAFSADVYAGLTYSQAIDSSIIGLANAMNLLTNNNSDKEFAYATSADIDTNIEAAVTSLAKNIHSLIKGETKIKFDINKDIPAVAEIIRFIRTLLVYLNTFSSEEITGSILSVDTVQKHKAAQFDITKNQFDVNKLFQSLSFMANNEDGVTVFKNIINILLSSKGSINAFGDHSKSKNDWGYTSILTKLTEQLAGQSKFEAAGFPVYVDSIIRIILNKGVGQTNIIAPMIFGALPKQKDKFPDFLKDLITKIDIKNGEEWQIFQNDWLDYLWENDNKVLNFTIKDMLKQPISDLTSKFSKPEVGFEKVTNSELTPLTNQSFQTIVTDIANDLSGKPAIINFDAFKDFITACQKDEVLASALNNPEKFFTTVGYDKDHQEIIKGSALEKLVNITSNSKWINSVINIFQKYIAAETEKLAAVKSDVIADLQKISVTTVETGNNIYSYSVTDGNVTSLYKIKLGLLKGKYVINSIDF
ncbi:hypothetical protein SCLARK_001084 [Spiroplasma clarkii]|nr:hypothetical protein [Spiroplasma clarkii]ARU91656.1 hypothetical protein SCLARK_001084 [Spiroplasma clarkii]